MAAKFTRERLFFYVRHEKEFKRCFEGASSGLLILRSFYCYVRSAKLELQKKNKSCKDKSNPVCQHYGQVS